MLNNAYKPILFRIHIHTHGPLDTTAAHFLLLTNAHPAALYSIPQSASWNCRKQPELSGDILPLLW